MKRIISILIALISLVSIFTSCKAEQGAEIVSMYDLSRSILKAVDFKDMTYISSEDKGAENLLAYVSDIEYSKVNSFFVLYAKDGKGNADEVAVLALKEKSDVPDAVQSLQKHLEKRKSVYSTYDPSQSEKVADGLVFSNGCYAVLIVSDNNKAVKSAFEDFVSGKTQS